MGAYQLLPAFPSCSGPVPTSRFPNYAYRFHGAVALHETLCSPEAFGAPRSLSSTKPHSGLSFRVILQVPSHQWAGFQFRVCKAFGCARPYQLPGFRAGLSCRDYQSLCRGPKSTSVLLSLCESLGFTGSLRRGLISNRLGLLQNHYRTSAPLLRSMVDLGT